MVMISFWADRHKKSCFTKHTPLTFFSNLFKKKKYKTSRCGESHSGIDEIAGQVTRVHQPTTVLSVSVMDMRLISPCPLSPALSTLTLTPGRTRDIDQDMQALRLSRQDNPFLQVLASRESLVDSLFDSDLDDANLMNQDGCNELDVDPLSLPEIHEHMIRSPPPTTWPKSPNFKIFKFPLPDESSAGTHQETHQRRSLKSPVNFLTQRQNSGKMLDLMPHQRSSSECRSKLAVDRSAYGEDRLLNRYTVRSMSDVRKAPNTLQLQRFT